jgi:uncharacterized protein YeaO (DUF488 family)
MHEIKTKRVYDPPAPGDGTRVLVDRLWPRGLTKEKVKADLWLKEAGPSNELRKWFHHESANWTEFKTRYEQELSAKPEIISELMEMASKGPLTLLYSAHSEEENQAVVIKEFLLKHQGTQGPDV